MKKLQKTFATFLLFLGLAGVFATLNTHVVFADTDIDDTVFGEDALTMKEVLDDEVKDKLDGVSKAPSLFLLIMGWVSFFLPYAGLLAFVGIVYAGFLYLTGFASEENIDKAKKILMWSVIGLIVIFMAYAIVNTFIDPTGGA